MTRSWRYFEVLASLVWDYGRMCLVDRRIRAMDFEDGLVDMKDEFLSRRYIRWLLRCAATQSKDDLRPVNRNRPDTLD